MTGCEPVIIAVVVSLAILGMTVLMVHALGQFNKDITFWALHGMISRMSLGFTPKEYDFLDDHDKSIVDRVFYNFKRIGFVAVFSGFALIFML